MNAEILEISEKMKSKYGGDLYYIFFKTEDGKSFKTCVATSMRNFITWKRVIVDKMIGAKLGGLRIKSGNVIDADSRIFLIKQGG